MKYITKLMIHDYNLKHYDMLGFKLTRKNATYHHIVPVRQGGIVTIENGAVLSKEAHETFNKIESIYPEYAEELNNYMYGYKDYYPLDVWYRIEYLMNVPTRKRKRK